MAPVVEHTLVSHTAVAGLVPHMEEGVAADLVHFHTAMVVADLGFHTAAGLDRIP